MKTGRSVYVDFGQHPQNTGANHCLWPLAGALQGWFRRQYWGYLLSNSYTAIRTKNIPHTTLVAEGSMPRTWCCTVFKCSVITCCISCHTPYPFITYPWTIPKPTSWRTTSCNRRRSPACGRRVRQETRCAGGTEWSRCLRRGLQEVFLKYFEWEWHRERVSCSQARTLYESQPIPTILQLKKGV